MRAEIRYNGVTPELWLVIGHQAFELALDPGDDSPEDCARWYKEQVDKALARQAAALQEAQAVKPDAIPPGVKTAPPLSALYEGNEYEIRSITVTVSRAALSTHRYVVTIQEDGMGEGVEIGTVAEIRDALPLVRAIAQIIENK